MKNSPMRMHSILLLALGVALAHLNGDTAESTTPADSHPTPSGAETAGAHPLRQRREEFGKLPFSPVGMLSRSDIQADLGLSDEVVREIVRLTPDLTQQRPEADEKVEKIYALMTDAQWRRFKEIVLGGNTGGNFVANSPEMQQRLNLSAAQLAQLRQQISEKNFVPGNAVMALLTEAQKPSFTAMLGQKLVRPQHQGLLKGGALAPEFEVQDPNGKPVRLSDYKGKVVILDFWATWCGPCQAAMPHLDEVTRKTKDQGVATLAICVMDNKAAYDRWIPKNTHYSFERLFDPRGGGLNSTAMLYGVTGGTGIAIPVKFVIGRDGKVVGGFAGNGEGDNHLERLLTEAGVKL